MIKTVLFDVDGVIIPRKRRFSINFSTKFGVPIEKLSQFFENEFQMCLVGKADLKEELKKYSKMWGWQKTTDELLDYWFGNESEIDNRILDEVKFLRSLGVKCFLCTDNEKYRVDYLLKNIGLEKYFDGIFSSGEIGYQKAQEKFWEKTYRQIGGPDKKSVLFWDDNIKNLEAAKKFGFLAELYVDFNDYKHKIKNYIK